MRRFYHHFLGALVLAGSVIGVSLLLGILGYHFVARFSWIDSPVGRVHDSLRYGTREESEFGCRQGVRLLLCAFLRCGLHFRHRHSIGAHVSSSTSPVSSRTEGSSATLFAPLNAAVDATAAERGLRHHVADWFG